MLSRDEVQSIRKETINADEATPRAFGALGDPGRWRMFRLLMEHKGLCVTDLANILNVTVPAVSQQLRIMETTGLIVRERDGQKICYRVRRDNPVARAAARIAKSDS